jgi:hypothetical protein
VSTAIEPDTSKYTDDCFNEFEEQQQEEGQVNESKDEQDGVGDPS